ncbi:hypothetical protein Bca52824_017282 [Brassica carinata]|uniref:Uncharacterized protein n=1 Tax=Brassica carinata TaxID=52824 RepID=A0A8X7VNR8_BRACI|nr:hypothetical protein Bca52824_017282 [Brassica carinata]
MGSKFHAFMYPCFAFGHMIPYLHLANKLAEKGHRITFLLPKKARKQLESLNLFPDSIFFHPLTLPPVEGLPVGVETTADLPPNTTGKLISDAMDLLRDHIEAQVRALKPDLIFFDLVPWVPEMAKEFGVKSVSYQIVSAACVAIALAPGVDLGFSQPSGYPSSKMALRGHDASLYSIFTNSHKRFFSRIITGLKNCDVVSIRTCAEVEGKYCSFIERECRRKVFLTGPMFPEPQEKNVKPLEDQWNHWLNGFEPGSVVFCALGSQTFLEKDQFQELCLGMELTGLPFLVAVKPPRGSSTIQEALPEGFKNGLKVVESFGRMGGTTSDIVSSISDQVITTKLLSEELEVSVKIHREDSGWFSKESLSDAVKSVMAKDSEIGN